MGKKKLYDVTDVEFQEVLKEARHRQFDTRARTMTPVEVTPTLKSFLKLTGRVLYYGAVGICLVVTAGRTGKFPRRWFNTRH
jgi:hypothetical protein